MVSVATETLPSLLNVERGYPLFWYDLNLVKGLRLTELGYNQLVAAKYDHWSFPLNRAELTAGILIQLSQKILAPWYLTTYQVTFFDKNISTAMILTDNDIDAAISLVYYQ